MRAPSNHKIIIDQEFTVSTNWNPRLVNIPAPIIFAITMAVAVGQPTELIWFTLVFLMKCTTNIASMNRLVLS